MDKFTRIYSIVVGLICLAIFIVWLANFNFRVSELNDLLEDDQMLADYPYQFRVISLNNGIAKLSSPRSAAMPAITFLGIIYPELKGSTAQEPDMIRAQKDLADHQMHAKNLIVEQADVSSTHWVLDRDWYVERGIYLE